MYEDCVSFHRFKVILNTIIEQLRVLEKRYEEITGLSKVFLSNLTVKQFVKENKENCQIVVEIIKQAKSNIEEETYHEPIEDPLAIPSFNDEDEVNHDGLSHVEEDSQDVFSPSPPSPTSPGSETPIEVVEVFIKEDHEEPIIIEDSIVNPLPYFVPVPAKYAHFNLIPLTIPLTRINSKTGLKSLHRTLQLKVESQLNHCKKISARSLSGKKQSLGLNETTQRKFSCTHPGCKLIFPEEFRLVAHVKRVHEKILKAFECNFCEYATSKIKDYLSHRKKHETNADEGEVIKVSNNSHNDQPIEPTNSESTKKFACTRQGCKLRFEEEFRLVAHVKRIHEKIYRAFECEKCEFAASKLKTYLTHLQKHGICSGGRRMSRAHSSEAKIINPEKNARMEEAKKARSEMRKKWEKRRNLSNRRFGYRKPSKKKGNKSKSNKKRPNKEFHIGNDQSNDQFEDSEIIDLDDDDDDCSELFSPFHQSRALLNVCDVQSGSGNKKKKGPSSRYARKMRRIQLQKSRLIEQLNPNYEPPKNVNKSLDSLNKVQNKEKRKALTEAESLGEVEQLPTRLRQRKQVHNSLVEPGSPKNKDTNETEIDNDDVEYIPDDEYIPPIKKKRKRYSPKPKESQEFINGLPVFGPQPEMVNSTSVSGVLLQKRKRRRQRRYKAKPQKELTPEELTKCCPMENCSKKTFPFRNEIMLNSHIRSVHEKEKLSYSCKMENCENQFLRYGELILHGRLTHEVDWDEELGKEYEENQREVCEDCGLRSLSVDDHSKQKHKFNIPCPHEHCDKAFPYTLRLKTHLALVHGEGKARFQCNLCGKVLSSEKSLKKHKKLELGEVNFLCHLCPMKFVEEQTFKNHLMCHNPERRFVCPTCGKKTKTKGEMNIHVRTHTGEKPYACPVCDKRFRNRNQMLLHRSLHGGESISCPFCDSTFPNRTYMVTHANKKHKDVPNFHDILVSTRKTYNSWSVNASKNKQICESLEDDRKNPTKTERDRSKKHYEWKHFNKYLKDSESGEKPIEDPTMESIIDSLEDSTNTSTPESLNDSIAESMNNSTNDAESSNNPNSSVNSAISNIPPSLAERVSLTIPQYTMNTSGNIRTIPLQSEEPIRSSSMNQSNVLPERNSSLRANYDNHPRSSVIENPSFLPSFAPSVGGKLEGSIRSITSMVSSMEPDHLNREMSMNDSNMQFHQNHPSHQTNQNQQSHKVHHTRHHRHQSHQRPPAQTLLPLFPPTFHSFGESQRFQQTLPNFPIQTIPNFPHPNMINQFVDQPNHQGTNNQDFDQKPPDQPIDFRTYYDFNN